MKWQSLYPWIWYAFLGIFVIGEGIPIIKKQVQYTLSEYLWRLEAVNSNWTFLRYLIAALCVWLFFHLAFGWFR